MRLFGKSNALPAADEMLPGRAQATAVPEAHFVNGNPLKPPYPETMEVITLGLGCFWGTEEIYWKTPGVFSTMVGYTGGGTPNPSYEEVCTGMTGHNEVTRVVFDPAVVSLEAILKTFWEVHDPTQGMRQGNDVGSQYRSGIYFHNEQQRELAEQSLVRYQAALTEAGRGKITTEIVSCPEFYYAEDYHQQYLAKNPNGYRCHANTGIAYPTQADVHA